MARAWRSRSLVLVALVGCGEDPNATLADLPGLTVDLIVLPHLDEAGQSMSQIVVKLRYDVDAFGAARDGGCAVLDEAVVHGAVDDIPLSLELPGRYDAESAECDVPQLVVNTVLPSEGITHLMVGDATQTIEARFPPALVVARQAVLVGGGSWAFPRGGAFTVRWSHPDDLAGLVAGGFPGYFHDDRGNAASLTGTATSVDTIELVVPADAPVAFGDLFLSVGRPDHSDDTHGVATSCTGADECTYQVSHSYAHTAQFE